MEQIVSPARKMVGEVTVPGELEPAGQALVLAALAEGESRIRNAPAALADLVGVLRKLGVEIASRRGGLVVQGRGPSGFRGPDGVLELSGLGETGLLVVALLAGRAFPTRVKLGEGHNRCGALLELLAPMGAALVRETEEVYFVGGTEELTGVAHPVADLDPVLKLAVLIAGLGAAGCTSLLESPQGRDQVVPLLRQRQVWVERRKQKNADSYLVSVEGGQPIQPFAVEIPGEVSLAYPLLAAALGLKGSELKIRYVAIHPGRRAFLDTMRHMGAPLAIEEEEDGTTHLMVRAGGLKSTRIAGPRTEKLVEQIPLLAVLATQAQGEFVIRDIGGLRQGDFDYVAHLVGLLRQIGARVGEFPEGLVIEGGYPLQGGRIETRGDVGLVLAFAVAGLLAETQIILTETECLDGIYPEFFATLEALKEKKK